MISSALGARLRENRRPFKTVKTYKRRKRWLA